MIFAFNKRYDEHMTKVILKVRIKDLDLQWDELTMRCSHLLRLTLILTLNIDLSLVCAL